MTSGVYKHKPLSEETKRKISLAHKGKKRPPFSKEWRENIGKGHKGQTPWNKGKKCPEISKRMKKLLKVRKDIAFQKGNKFGTLNKGSKNPRWKGGRRNHTEGYIQILMPQHPFCDSNGYVFEHRLVMEKHLKRYLKKVERVHHLNGIKSDNKIENLILFPSESEHQKREWKIKRALKTHL